MMDCTKSSNFSRNIMMNGRACRNIARTLIVAIVVVLGGCAQDRDPMQTIRDGLFYDGLAAFHEGFHKEAATRWERAAHFGDGDAARNLGHLYRQGLGVDQDASIAMAWYQVASDAGNISAQYNMGMLYQKGGINLPPDRALALRWLGKAAAAGVAPARVALDRLAAEPAAQEQQAAAVPVTEPAIKTPPPALPQPMAEPAPAKVKVQVGSYRRLADAEKDWRRLKRPGLDPEIVEVRLPDRGKWFRLLAQGPLDTVEAYCRDMEKHRIGCWPGKPRSMSR